jgi:hypothetical protein
VARWKPKKKSHYGGLFLAEILSMPEPRLAMTGFDLDRDSLTELATEWLSTIKPHKADMEDTYQKMKDDQTLPNSPYPAGKTSMLLLQKQSTGGVSPQPLHRVLRKSQGRSTILEKPVWLGSRPAKGGTGWQHQKRMSP